MSSNSSPSSDSVTHSEPIPINAASNMSHSSDPVSHSEPIPINAASSQRTRPRSNSEASFEDDSIPPLSPASDSPASAPGAQTPVSSHSRTSISPSSPILSYFYGKPFGGGTTTNKVFEDEESQDPPPTLATSTVHNRRMSASWAPVRFTTQQSTSATESQQERGASVLRRLSLSGGPGKPFFQGGNATPPNSPDGGMVSPEHQTPRLPGQHRKAATLSAGTVDASRVPRAPSPMGERILKGFFDGF